MRILTSVKFPSFVSLETNEDAVCQLSYQATLPIGNDPCCRLDLKQGNNEGLIGRTV